MANSKIKSRDLEDMQWLVKSRSRNQEASVELYRLFQQHAEQISERTIFRVIAQSLLGVTFSLWRAVFLSDIERTRGLMMADAEAFLKNLIENNTVAYQQDKAAKHWTFRYYLANANNVLRKLHDADPPHNIVASMPRVTRDSSQVSWTKHQDCLDLAIKRFGELLEAAEDGEESEEDSNLPTKKRKRGKAVT